MTSKSVPAIELVSYDVEWPARYLRTHPVESDTYAAAKLRLLHQSGGDRAWYVDNKIPVVDAMLAAAGQWYDAQAN